jgi:hydrogenase-4 component E
MSEYAEVVLVALLALDLYMVSTTRLDACIRATVLQAFILAALPFALGAGHQAPFHEQLHLLGLAAGTQVAKGVVIPWLLFRALRDLGSDREFQPFVSLHYSQVINGALCGVGFWVASALPWPVARASTLALGAGISTMLVGLYMTINRRRTISQVLGYLVIESGLFVLGWTLLDQPSLLLELGILLDLLVAVMVMGILVTHADLDGATDDEPSVAGSGGEP